VVSLVQESGSRKSGTAEPKLVFAPKLTLFAVILAAMSATEQPQPIKAMHSKGTALR
jgi:hypothetical protein